MKTDNFVLLESLFLPEYRHRLFPLMQQLLAEKEDQEEPTASSDLIDEHVKELEDKELVVVSPDKKTFKKLLRYHKKLIYNRMRAFKIINESEVTPESSDDECYDDDAAPQIKGN